MASRMLYNDIKTMVIGVVLIPFKIDIAADGSVVSAVGGRGVTVSKTGTGQYTAALADKWNDFLNIQLTLQADAAADLVPQVRSYSASSKSVVIETMAYDGDGAAAATNPAQVCEIHGLIIAKNSSV